MDRNGSHLTAIVKPTHDCNLKCKYCYVPNEAEKGTMTESTLFSTMTKIAEASPYRKVRFVWHGGEPLLMGIEFFQKVSEISHDLRRNGFHISNVIQTNATLISEEFLDFVESENDFRIGTSLDGPKEINDKVRCFPDGQGAYESIISGIKRIKARCCSNGENSIGGGVIVVLSKANLNNARLVYDFFNNSSDSFHAAIAPRFKIR